MWQLDIQVNDDLPFPVGESLARKNVEARSQPRTQLAPGASRMELVRIASVRASLKNRWRAKTEGMASAC